MSEEHLSRRRLLQAGGGVVVSSTMLGKVASAAASTTQASGSDNTIAMLTAVHGHRGSATAANGTLFNGTIQNQRPLRIGDRVVVESSTDGYTISPLFVEVVGTVDSVDSDEVTVAGSSYRVDSRSVLRRLDNGQWLDHGPIAKGVAQGSEIEGLGITNLQTGDTVLAVAWAR